MKKFVNTLVLIILIAFLGAMAIHLYGMTLPENFSAGGMAFFRAPRSIVWKTLTDYQDMANWWPEVKKVEIETKPDGSKITWMTRKDGQRLPFATVEEIPEKKLVRKIADDQLPFGGTWTFELSTHADTGIILMIREEGFVKAPFFRVMMKLSGGSQKSIDGFVKAMEKRIHSLPK